MELRRTKKKFNDPCRRPGEASAFRVGLEAGRAMAWAKLLWEKQINFMYNVISAHKSCNPNCHSRVCTLKNVTLGD
jgi:hypothetical protein